MNSNQHDREITSKIGVVFKNKNLLTQAFTHRSYLNESKQITSSNERLEFLGDAILSFVSSYYLYTSYPELSEGMLTNVRSSIVKTEALARVAQELSFGSFLLLSKGEEEGGGRTNPSLLADCFEAFLGALFIDQGLPAVEKLLKQHLFPQIESVLSKKTYMDAKSRLQEKIQEKEHISPIYRVIKTEGKDHAKTFWIEVIVGTKVLGTGNGRSKQEAEQRAAENALEKMGKT